MTCALDDYTNVPVRSPLQGRCHLLGSSSIDNIGRVSTDMAAHGGIISGRVRRKTRVVRPDGIIDRFGEIRVKGRVSPTVDNIIAGVGRIERVSGITRRSSRNGGEQSAADGAVQALPFCDRRPFGVGGRDFALWQAGIGRRAGAIGRGRRSCENGACHQEGGLKDTHRY